MKPKRSRTEPRDEDTAEKVTQMGGHNFVPRENYITIRVFSDPFHTQVGIEGRSGSAASMQKCIREGVWGVRGDPSSNIPAWGGPAGTARHCLRPLPELLRGLSIPFSVKNESGRWFLTGLSQTGEKPSARIRRIQQELN